MFRFAFVDDPLYAKEFRSGDIVRKAGVRNILLSPYVGRVLYSDTETGKVSVQWPWGVESESATELVKDASGDYVSPALTDQSYSTWESARWTSSPDIEKSDAKWRSSLASDFERYTLPVWRAACYEWHNGTNEIEAVMRVSSEMSEDYGFDVVRRTVGNLYGLGRRLAIYWKDSKRRYKVTQREMSSGKHSCPRCGPGSILKPIVYSHGEKILSCRGCGFSIHPTDLIKPKMVPVKPVVKPVMQPAPVKIGPKVQAVPVKPKGRAI